MNNVDRQEDHFNVNTNANNGVVNMEEEVNEADDITNNNEVQGVGGEDPLAHIEDDDEEDSMLEDLPETEDSDSNYGGDNEEEDAMLEDIEHHDEKNNEAPEPQQPDIPRISQTLINAVTGETHGVQPISG